MQLTQKISISPSIEQQDLFWILAEKCRLIYNFALKERQEHWNRVKLLPEKEQTLLSYQAQQNQLPALKEKYPAYKWVYSKVLQMTLKPSCASGEVLLRHTTWPVVDAASDS